MVKDIALHGARVASRALRTYERPTRTEQGGKRGYTMGSTAQFPARLPAGHTTGPGRKPGASLYTRKRLSPLRLGLGRELTRVTYPPVTM